MFTSSRERQLQNRKTKTRQDYQLEPALVIRNRDPLNKTDAVFYSEALNPCNS